MTKPLENKVALVTGASRGIGAAIVQRLAADGVAVAFTYASSPAKADELVKVIEAAGGKALAIQADNADAAAIQNAVAETVRVFGRLDILVNNAGVIKIGSLEDFSLEDFDHLVAINVRGAFVATQAAARHMDGEGRIINIGSTNADRIPFAGGSVYSMTKSAIAGLTRGLARDLGPRGITVNTIQPGPIDTEANPADSAFAETMKGFMALHRYGHTAEIAGMVAYLASKEAAFITGACLTIDGGFAA